MFAITLILISVLFSYGGSDITIESGLGIVGGMVANLGDIPYIVAVNRCLTFIINCLEWDFRGGGSIISHRWVITAGHIIRDGHFAVRTGTLEPLRDGYLYSVAEIIIHPNYTDKKNHTVHHNDIALLRLDEDIAYSGTIGEIRMATSRYYPDVPVYSLVYTAGYGKECCNCSLDNARLKYATMKTIPFKACDEIYDTDSKIICTEDPNQTSTTCFGDSGGPLTIRVTTAEGTQPILIGVVNSGRNCTPTLPAKFASVGKHRGWIRYVTGF